MFIQFDLANIGQTHSVAYDVMFLTAEFRGHGMRLESAEREKSETAFLPACGTGPRSEFGSTCLLAGGSDDVLCYGSPVSTHRDCRRQFVLPWFFRFERLAPRTSRTRWTTRRSMSGWLLRWRIVNGFLEASKNTDLPVTSRMDSAKALLRRTRYSSRCDCFGHSLSRLSRAFSSAVLPREPVRIRCTTSLFASRILVSKDPGSNGKFRDLICSATRFQKLHSLMFRPHEHL